MKGIAIAIFFTAMMMMPISAAAVQNNNGTNHVELFNTDGLNHNNSSLRSVLYFNNPGRMIPIEKQLNKFNVDFQSGKKYIDVYGNMPIILLRQLKSEQSTSGFNLLNGSAGPQASPMICYNATYQNAGDPTYVPQNIWNAYNVTNYSTRYGGSGETVAIVDAYGDPFLAYDLSVFDHTNNLLPTNVSIYEPFGPMIQTNFNWSIETSTDVEWVHAMAQRANILLVLVPNASSQYLQEAINLTVQNRMANVISLSWGVSENEMLPGLLNQYSNTFKQAAIDNISVVAASGDRGAFNGGKSLAVNFPASSPYVTAVGGTTLNALNGKFSQAAWGGGSGQNSFGSGGGFSSVFTAPKWQNPYGYNSTMRGVPDVSLDANKQTGVVVVDDNFNFTVGGTSIAAPMWAGMIAILDQVDGRSLGFINPLLYQISKTDYYGKALNSVSTGNNGYYKANYGWNPVTGLGTPNIGWMVKAIRNLTGPGGYEAIMAPPKDMASFNVSTYLNVSGTTVPMDNGSTFSFLSLQYAPGMGIFTGIKESYGEYKAVIKLVTGNYSSSYSYNIGNATNLKLWINVNGNFVTAGFNSGFHKFILFPEYLYESYIAVGLGRTGIYGNLYGFPSVSFSYPVISGKTTYAEKTFYGLYLNNTAAENYSSVNLTSNSRILDFSYGQATHSSIDPIKNMVGNRIEITLSLNETNGIISGILSQYSGNGTFYQNGNKIVGNTYNFSPPGPYNITFKSATVTTYIDIVIPQTLNSTLDIATSLDFNFSLETNVTLDNFLTFQGGNGSQFYLLKGNNSVSLFTKGFKDYSSNLNASSITSVNLTPEYVSLIISTSPANSSIDINGIVKQDINGISSFSLLPGKITITATHKYFASSNSTLYVYPGMNETYPVYLTPLSRMIAINGIVKNSKFHFNVPDVLVKYNNSDYSYTNSQGRYLLYVPVGPENISYYAEFYKQYNVSENSSTNTSINVDISFFLNTNPYLGNPTIAINRAIPLLFFTLFLGWTLTDVSSVNYLEIHYYQLGSPDNSSLKVSAGSTYTMINGIYPGKSYVFYIEVFLNDGQYFFSKGVEISYSNISFLALNISIAAFIALAIFSAASSIKKRIKRKKAFDKLMEETYGSRKKWK